MIPVYKAGGAWKTKEGVEYTSEIVHTAIELKKRLANGWVRNLSELKKAEPKAEDNKSGEQMSDRERFLRDEIEKLTGKKPGGRSTVETLEKQYAELSEG